MTNDSASAQPKTLRVLMIEDSEDDALLITRHLQRHGYSVQAKRVEDLQSFLQALTESWDIILSDHSMPEMSSIQSLHSIQERQLDIPFILVSGTIGEAQAVAAMKAGAHDFVMKDRLGRLVPAIERELSDAAQRKARREAEDALRRSEARYRELVEEIPAVTYIAALDESRTVYFISSQIDNWLGTTPAMHRHLWMHFTHPEDAHYVHETLQASCNSGEPFSCEYRLVGMDGRIIWVRDSATVVREEGGRMPFARGFLVNISEQRRAEAELKEREIELQRIQRLESIGRLAGGVAHDFNNLLTPIVGYGRLLSEMLPHGSDLQDCANEIVRASERATKLTRQLLTFSRRRGEDSRFVDVNRVLSEMHRFLRSTIGDHIDLATVLSDKEAIIHVDPTNMEQVIMNLAVNARDAMPTGGRITIGTAIEDVDKATAEREAVEPGAYVVLFVRDTGMGMTPEVRDKIFEPFFTTKPEGHGTGLGLAIIYNIVKKSGGFIELITEPGKGTEFRLFFPYCTNRDEALPQELPVTPTGTENVLVVDDDEVVRQLVVRYLETLGYHTTSASSADEALERYRNNARHFDAVVTDIVMPHGSGRMLAETLRAEAPTLPVLYISGFSQEISEEGLHKDGTALLMKPFTKESLGCALRNVLDRQKRM